MIADLVESTLFIIRGSRPPGPTATRPTATSTAGPTSHLTTVPRTPSSRPGDLQLGVRRPRRPVVPAPVLQEHAGPEHRQPEGPRRDPQGGRLLAWSSACPPARRVRLRSALPAPSRPDMKTPTSTCGPSAPSWPAGAATPPCSPRRTCLRLRAAPKASSATRTATMYTVFNFVANQRLFPSLVRQQAAPLAEARRGASSRDRPATTS